MNDFTSEILKNIHPLDTVPDKKQVGLIPIIESHEIEGFQIEYQTVGSSTLYRGEIIQAHKFSSMSLDDVAQGAQLYADDMGREFLDVLYHKHAKQIDMFFVHRQKKLLEKISPLEEDIIHNILKFKINGLLVEGTYDVLNAKKEKWVDADEPYIGYVDNHSDFAYITKR